MRVAIYLLIIFASLACSASSNDERSAGSRPSEDPEGVVGYIAETAAVVLAGAAKTISLESTTLALPAKTLNKDAKVRLRILEKPLKREKLATLGEAKSDVVEVTFYNADTNAIFDSSILDEAYEVKQELRNVEDSANLHYVVVTSPGTDDEQISVVANKGFSTTGLSLNLQSLFATLELVVTHAIIYSIEILAGAIPADIPIIKNTTKITSSGAGKIVIPVNDGSKGVVANPVFSPASGTYTSAQSINLSTTSAGSTIRFTTDGSDPDASTGTVYTEAINIAVTTTIKAIAYQEGYENSAVTAAVFSIKSPYATEGEWGQQAYLKAPNADESDYFGGSVVISEDTVIVGVPSEQSNQTGITNGSSASSDNSLTNAGAGYVFIRSGSTWANQAYIKPPTINSTTRFGYNVTISGETMVATSVNGILIFSRTGNDWSLQTSFASINLDMGDDFGASIGISGDTIVVGAPSEASSQKTITNGDQASSDNSKAGIGAAYVYHRTGTTWSQQAYLKAPNGESDYRFGSDVAIEGDTIVVGAPGEDSGQASITHGGGASNDTSANASGAAYVFRRTATNWALEAYIKASNTDALDLFGTAVIIENETIAITAPNESSNQTGITNGSTSSSDNSGGGGAIYIYQRSGSVWSQKAYIKANDPGSCGGFGGGLDISGDTLIAQGANAAYVFIRNGDNWSQQTCLMPPYTATSDDFGRSVAIDGQTIAVGAVQDDSDENFITNGPTISDNNGTADAGAVYIFKRE